VASGETTCVLGDRDITVSEGGFVFIPRGTPHTAWNSGDPPMLGMIVISPGGAERAFEPARTT
jgi:mannose-6-phosphate isomerase-like protein (cupin superfamily)